MWATSSSIGYTVIGFVLEPQLESIKFTSSHLIGGVPETALSPKLVSSVAFVFLRLSFENLIVLLIKWARTNEYITFFRFKVWSLMIFSVFTTCWNHQIRNSWYWSQCGLLYGNDDMILYVWPILLGKWWSLTIRHQTVLHYSSHHRRHHHH